MAALRKALAVLAVVLALVAPVVLAAELCLVPQTYGIAIDHSGSVSTDPEYKIQKQFVAAFIDASYVAGSQYYIVSYADSVSPPIVNTYNAPSTKQGLMDAVTNYPRPGSGNTGIGNAIQHLTNALAPKVSKGTLVIITDGTDNVMGNPAAIAKADAARAAGFKVVIIGVGMTVPDDINQLTAMAGPSASLNPGQYIPIPGSGFDGLPGQIDTVIKAACPCIDTCRGRTAPTTTCPNAGGWSPCQSCVTNSLVLSYTGAKSTCYKCLAAGPDNLDRCFWCVTNALTLAKRKTAFCSCCDKVYNCYNALENSLVNQKGWERYVIRCKEKFSTPQEQDSCFWCLTNALTTNPRTCTGDRQPFCTA